MEWISAIAIYFIIWWTVLFTVLPIGVRSQAEAGEIAPGTPHSAPAAPRILRKMMITTVISAAVFALFYVLTQVYGLGSHSIPGIIPGT